MDLEEERTPLRNEGPGRRKVRTISVALGLGGRQSKRVRSVPPTHVTQETSSRMQKRLDVAGAPQRPMHERLQPIAENNCSGDNAVQEESSAIPENNTCNEHINGCSSPFRDWARCEDDGNAISKDEAPTQRGGRRKAREATREVLLDRMNKATGTRMHISILEGNKRPHVPEQAAKFSSEASVAVRSQVPILTHWKEYKEQPELFDGFVGRLSGRLAIDTRQQPTTDACSSVFQKSIRQMRYKLKQKYFVGVPANEIRKTSPVPSMTDAQWCRLVDKWSSAHNREVSEKNKLNWGRVLLPSATGSRCYAA